MITSQELSRSLYGTIRLAKGDPSGLQYFNATLEGFWNSVAAAVIVLPGYAFMTWLGYFIVPAEASDSRIVLVEAIAYVTHWAAFQLALFYYCRVVGKENRFFHAAVALNWIDVPAYAVMVGLQLLLLAVGGGGGLGDLVSFMLWILLIAYSCYVAKVALQSSLLVAIGPFGIAFLLNQLLSAVTAHMVMQG
ncbi:MAG: hypothetical protein R3F55_01820 [Alphaproteobacteria bacterium]